ncbi:hypothetical protein KRP22_009721 [Phytophthora ramorum]|nr:hypothetical protein KRP22_14667 [Phytophthora ramorum]
MANVMPTNRYGKSKLPETKQNQPSSESVTNPTLTSDNEKAIELELVCETGDEQQSSDSETESATTSDNEEPVELGLVSEADDEQPSSDSGTDEDLSNADSDDDVNVELVSEAAEEQSRTECEPEDTQTTEDDDVEMELVSVVGVLVPISEVPDRLKHKYTGKGEELSDEEGYESPAGTQKKSTPSVSFASMDHEVEGMDSDDSECFY